jgi:hypothetical protein
MVAARKSGPTDESHTQKKDNDKKWILFVPGTPLEGIDRSLIVHNSFVRMDPPWTSATGTVEKYMMEGVMVSYGIAPTTFQITSTDQIQSVLWVGKVGQIQVTKVIQFKNTDVYFSTTVTIQTLVHPLCGIYTVSDLSSPPSFYLSTLILFRYENCRSGSRAVLLWQLHVQYQPYAADGSD